MWLAHFSRVMRILPQCFSFKHKLLETHQLFAHHPPSHVLAHFLHLPESLYCLTWWCEGF
jgi:hypothetical protein